ncbi:hypothetical protein RQP54_16570 [Curvibacter sp. APW13]|uniref:hypothetical protein n=1 Tax=Curvibacter sp. APW13 TaxID=3077236 RepID=UPI0028E00177|nr:hypothetical protein [Curvibacter sp. APW13]MDT8992486.1 hypothetical protein [Curvibacter sp. APW13]
MRKEHRFFERFPLDAHVQVGDEKLTSPYHVYDGTLLLVGGTVESAQAAALLGPSGLHPVRDTEGRALAAVWVGDFTEANLGPHHELQISLLASRGEAPPVVAHPLAMLVALVTQPQVRVVCHGLWNSTQRVVRYNAEHLGLDARFGTGILTRAGSRWQFEFSDIDGQPLVQGALDEVRRMPTALAWELARRVGWAAAWRALRDPVVQVPVLNTLSPYADTLEVAQTYTLADRQSLRLATESDALQISVAPYAALGFTPAFVQQLEGLRFIYLRPRPEAV